MSDLLPTLRMTASVMTYDDMRELGRVPAVPTHPIRVLEAQVVIR